MMTHGPRHHATPVSARGSSLKQRLIDICFRSDLEMIRLGLGFAALIWAVILGAPSTSALREPELQLLNQILAPHTWAALWAIHGTLMLYALFGRSNKRRPIFLVDAMLGCALWTATATTLVLASTTAPIYVSSHVLAAFASWLVLVRTHPPLPTGTPHHPRSSDTRHGAGR